MKSALILLVCALSFSAETYSATREWCHLYTYTFTDDSGRVRNGSTIAKSEEDANKKIADYYSPTIYIDEYRNLAIPGRSASCNERDGKKVDVTSESYYKLSY